MFFDGWQSILRVLVLGPLAYIALVAVLRIGGKRTLSKMNAFDFVVTISLGSIMAAIVLNSNISLVSGVLAVVVLVLCQIAVTSLSVRWRRFERLIKDDPTLLYYQGEFLEDQLRRVRVTETEVLAAIREQGHPSLERVRAVVLETDSDFSVLVGDGELSALRNVQPLAEHRAATTAEPSGRDRGAGA